MTVQLSLEALLAALDEGATVVDIRPPSSFAQGHIPGTINIPGGGSFMTWVDWILDPDEPVYVIAPPQEISAIEEVFLSLGLEQFTGYFDLSIIEFWSGEGRKLQTYEETTAQIMAEQVRNNEVTVLDVRQPNEWMAGHIPGARHIPLADLLDQIEEVPVGKPIVVQCHSGVRSAVGASLLQAKGVTDVKNLLGGIMVWTQAGLPIEQA